jgi:hypothetical protein
VGIKSATAKKQPKIVRLIVRHNLLPRPRVAMVRVLQVKHVQAALKIVEHAHQDVAIASVQVRNPKIIVHKTVAICPTVGIHLAVALKLVITADRIAGNVLRVAMDNAMPTKHVRPASAIVDPVPQNFALAVVARRVLGKHVQPVHKIVGHALQLQRHFAQVAVAKRALGKHASPARVIAVNAPLQHQLRLHLLLPRPDLLQPLSQSHPHLSQNYRKYRNPTPWKLSLIRRNQNSLAFSMPLN